MWPGSHRTIEQWFAAELACERERASSSSGSPDVVSAVLQRVVERNVGAAPRRGKGARYTSAPSLRTTTTCTAERRGG